MSNPTQDDVAAWLQSAARNVEAALTAAEKRVLAAASSLRVASGMAGLGAQRLQPFPDVEVLLARVQAVLREDEPERLTKRERRAACSMFERFEPSDLERLLVGAREWRVFLDALFSRRHLMPGDEFLRWEGLLRRAPREMTFLADEALRQVVLEPDSSLSAAQTALFYGRESSLEGLLQAATGRERLSPRWQYTSSVVGFWLLRNAEPREERWEEIKQDVRLEAMLLPRAREVVGSSFDKGGRTQLPAGIPDNPLAQAAAVSALLLPGGGAPLNAGAEALLREIVFRSSFRDPREFRDPRMAPETVGWQHVRALSPKGYEGLLEKLISEDMQVFFEYIETDQDRGRFWQQFLKHICGTGFFLSDETKDRLGRVFSGAHLEMKARLRRTNRLLDQKKGDAFYLMFQNHVVIEFSQKGNAAFVYERSVFERELLKKAMWITNLKKAHYVERLKHHEGWEHRFRDRLIALGAVRGYGGGSGSRPTDAPVASAPPRFMLAPGGRTVIDRVAKLEWQRDCGANPCAPLAECRRFASLLYLEGSGWRLPTQAELKALVKMLSRVESWLFPEVKRHLWTSSMHPELPRAAWAVDAWTGEGSFVDEGRQLWCWCVRSLR